ncbi:hypothetical protein DFQ28_003959 [Apophysomyces sp. BC1034]|nr:hypothetical protein DFQ29_003186 [Apophysomyces sp. BC1021]KAG0189059.1 hypothetical protein DFQ28_003959 [Apophysomyces sp. BC1034]
MTEKGKQPSSRLLGMKFMQRSLEKEKQEQLERERKRIISEAEWTIEYETDDVQKTKIRVEYEPSYLSFANNATVSEKDEEEQQRLERETAKEKASEISDSELLKRMRTVRSVSNPKTKKRGTDGGDKGKKKKVKVEPTGFIKPE